MALYTEMWPDTLCSFDATAHVMDKVQVRGMTQGYAWAVLGTIVRKGKHHWKIRIDENIQWPWEGGSVILHTGSLVNTPRAMHKGHSVNCCIAPLRASEIPRPQITMNQSNDSDVADWWQPRVNATNGPWTSRLKISI